MNLVSIKTAAQAVLDGIRVEIQKHDNTIKEVTLTDISGRMVSITVAEYGSGLKLLVPEPPRMEWRFIVSGEVVGIKVAEAYEDERAAKERVRQIENASGTASISSKEVEVMEDGSANIGASPTGDLPF